MHAIDEFRISLNISDHEELHDYATGQTVYRPKGGDWSPAAFTGTGTIGKGAKCQARKQLWVDLMDSAICDRENLELAVDKGSGQHEKQTGEAGDDMHDDHFDDQFVDSGLPARVLPRYEPGDVVRGHIVLRLNAELQAEKIRLEFRGQAVCNMETFNHYGEFDDTAVQAYVLRRRSVWLMASKDMDGFAELCDMSRVTSAPARSKTLLPGSHHFSFEFTIPQSAAQSMPPLVLSSVNSVNLIYRLKATIVTGSLLTLGNFVTHKAIWVTKSYDINSDPANMEPLSVRKCLEGSAMPLQCLPLGNIRARAELSRSAFIKGEAIPVFIEVSNDSLWDINKVEARLVLQGKAVMGRRKTAKPIRLNSQAIAEGPVAAGTSQTFRWQLPWDFSRSSVDGELLPVGKLDDSRRIKMGYEVEVKVKRTSLCGGLEMRIPIVVGTEDSSGTAPPRMSNIPPL